MQEEAEQMIVVFTVSWTFVIALLIIAAAIGYGVLTFVAQHIVAISAFVWLPILWFIRKTWRDRTIPDEKKVGTTVKAILQLPTYAAMVQAVLSIVYEWVSGGLLGMVLFLIEMPVTLSDFYGQTRTYKIKDIDKKSMTAQLVFDEHEGATDTFYHTAEEALQH